MQNKPIQNRGLSIFPSSLLLRWRVETTASLTLPRGSGAIGEPWAQGTQGSRGPGDVQGGRWLGGGFCLCCESLRDFASQLNWRRAEGFGGGALCARRKKATGLTINQKGSSNKRSPLHHAWEGLLISQHSGAKPCREAKRCLFALLPGRSLLARSLAAFQAWLATVRAAFPTRTQILFSSLVESSIQNHLASPT